MPILFLCLPLMIFAVLPGTQMTTALAWVPLTGLVLWLRLLLNGQLAEALPYTLPVLTVIGLSCWWGVRWAANRFQQESMLFPQAHRWNFRSLVRALSGRRGHATWQHAIGLGVGILLVRFLLSTQLPPPADWNALAWMQTAALFATVGLPTILAAWLVARPVKHALGLARPRLSHVALAALAAVVFHPVGVAVATWAQSQFPVGEAMAGQLEATDRLVRSAPSLLSVLLVFAAVPAICEELAFRGFLLRGFLAGRRSPWTAVVLSSFFFGLTHVIAPQAFAAFCIGLVLGLLAIWTGSIWAGMAFHAVYNAMTFLLSELAQAGATSGWGARRFWLMVEDGTWTYRPVAFGIGGVLTLWLLSAIYRTRVFSDRSGMRPFLNRGQAGDDGARPITGDSFGHRLPSAVGSSGPVTAS